MIITNPALKPSERLIEMVLPYFLNKGFSYKKSQRLFTRPYQNGNQILGFWFKISTLTEASLFWGVQLTKLEKIYAELIGHPRKYNSFYTLSIDLPNYLKSDNYDDHTFLLYDLNDFKYSDISINKAAEKIIYNYESIVCPYYQMYFGYSEIEQFYNNREFKHIRGLILAKYLSKDYFEKLIIDIRTQTNERYNGKDSEEMKVLETM